MTVTVVTVGTDVTDLFISKQEAENMTRQARFTLPQPVFDDLHHACIDLARKRGVKKLSLAAVVQEAVEMFLEQHGRRRRGVGQQSEQVEGA